MAVPNQTKKSLEITPEALEQMINFRLGNIIEANPGSISDSEILQSLTLVGIYRELKTMNAPHKGLG
jgi:hypothetical protein